MANKTKELFNELCGVYPIKLFDRKEFELKLPDMVIARDHLIHKISAPIWTLISDEVADYLGDSDFHLEALHLFTVSLKVSSNSERTQEYTLNLFFDISRGNYKPMEYDLAICAELTETNVRFYSVIGRKRKHEIFTEEFIKELVEKVKKSILA